ncbi:MAG: serine/threonine kinase PknH [Mycobacterium sp.]|nr:serine/threonine kinase PknH [Mycobacterium sp.]
MKVFVCYSRHDSTAVNSLANELKSAAQEVWYDIDLRGGTTWWQTVLDQIRLCTVFVFAVSDKSMASKPCQAELRYAQDLRIPVLFLIIGETESSVLPVFSADAIDYRDSSRGAALALMSALHKLAAERGPLPDPLPEPPPIPYEFLLRIGGIVRSSNEISHDEQRDLLLDLEGGLADDEDETVRADVRKLLQALRARSDVTYTTASRIDELIRKHALSTGASGPIPTAPPPPAYTRPPPQMQPPPLPPPAYVQPQPTAPLGGPSNIAPLTGPTNWSPPPPGPLPPGPGRSSGNSKLIFAGIAAAVLVAVVVVIAIVAWPKSDSDSANKSTTSSSSSTADSAFLSAIKGKGGMTFPSDEYAIQTAKQVCQLLDEGQKPEDVATEISKNSGIPLDKSGFFVGASIGAYCPKHLDQVK